VFVPGKLFVSKAGVFFLLVHFMIYLSKGTACFQISENHQKYCHDQNTLAYFSAASLAKKEKKFTILTPVRLIKETIC
jgi:hypothetical protein